MKILHLSSESSWRGGEQQIAYLIEALRPMEIEPLVACKPDSEFESLCRARRWEYEGLPMKNSADLKSAFRLKGICKTRSIDIVHAHSSHGHSTAFLAYLLGNRTPVVVTRRVDFSLKDNPFSRLKYTFPKIKRIACVSNAIRDIIAAGTRRPEICQTIYSAIDHRRFEPHLGSDRLRRDYGIEKDVILIGNTSALAPHKDYFTFVRTADHLIRHFHDKVRFFVIGAGEQEAEIKAFVKDMGLEKYFIFTGFLNNIAEVLPSLDIFFISSKTEGLGTSVIDAFAAKVPVVATRAGGIPELVKNGQTGLLSDVGDFKELAGQLHSLIRDTSMRDALTRTAFAYAEQFSTERMAQQYKEVYQEILSES